MSEDPFDTDEWRDYARHARDELVPKISDSMCTISLVPDGETDMKFALELGVSMMLDKPIILMIQPGTKVPGKLARVADAIVEFDPSLPAAVTQARITAAIEQVAPDQEG